MAGRADDRIHKICFVRAGHDGDAQAFERALSLAEHAGADLNIVSVVEEPSAGIVKLLERWGADFETITGFLMGNTAETVLEQADCSIAVLKPPGFISPVGI